MRTETLSIKVSKAFKVKLKATARKRKTTPSKLFRQALSSLIENDYDQKQNSCFDLLQDIVEHCGEGPKNLSHDKKFMKGFGK